MDPTHHETSYPTRRSIIFSTDSSSKRLSTTSTHSREAPKPVQLHNGACTQSTARSPAVTTTGSPDKSITILSPPPLTSSVSKHKIPSFPPPQQSRVSAVTTISSSRDSFHAQFESSLSYASVRDFAYPSKHPLHYGPTLSEGLTTPGDSQRGSGYGGSGGSWFTGGGSGYRRLSDPAAGGGGGWNDHIQFRQRQSNHPPPLTFADGPPWSEDDDLQSPVVVSNQRGRRSSASQVNHARGQSKNGYPDSRDEHPWRRGSENDHGHHYNTSRAELVNGEPGGELYHHQEEDEYDDSDDGYYNPDYVYSDDEDGEYDGPLDYNSRFSKDYQFTIASPAEEMQGKAVALFDFIQENENELPLVEGQVVWVSYRHGMGWLVAEDPKTGESGLVPEEYVCLLRDMHGHSPHPGHVGGGVIEMGSATLAPDVTISSDGGCASEHRHSRSPSPRSALMHSSLSPRMHPPLSPHMQGMHPFHQGDDVHPEAIVMSSSQKDRIEQIRREQERAVAEEEQRLTLKLRSEVFEVVTTNGSNNYSNFSDIDNVEGEFFKGKKESQGIDFRENRAT